MMKELWNLLRYQYGNTERANANLGRLVVNFS